MRFLEYVDFIEKKEHFEERTYKHIKLVKKYANRVVEKYEKFKELIDIAENHDKSKFEDPEYEPYVYINWKYKCLDDGIEFDMPDGMDDKMIEATEHHIKNNRHHPEYHSDKEDNLIDVNDRDKGKSSTTLIDARKMKDIDIAEMVADWCAVSEEKNNNPKDWADKNVNVRWKFDDKQKKLIYEIIDRIWRYYI